MGPIATMENPGGRPPGSRYAGTVLARHWSICLLVGLGLVVILLVGDDFGPSWDDPANAKIGAAALQVYLGDREYFAMPAQADHGPFFFMLSAAGSKALGMLLPTWRNVDRRHIMNAMALLVGLCALYAICLRHMGKRAAAVATWLFAMQPLILGHGFVNQKDTPFLGFFAASVAMGLYAADAWASPRLSRETQVKLVRDTRPASPGRVGIACACTIIAVVWFVDWWGAGWTQQAAMTTLARLYSGEIGGWLRNLFLLVATDSHKTPLALYEEKARDLFLWTRLAIAPMWLALVLWYWRRASQRVSEATRKFAAGPYPLLLLAGVCLGCTISIRQYAVLAGCMVGVVMVVNARRGSVQPLALYGLTAAVTTYATWPFLWANPVGGFLQSLGRAGGYADTTVLFRGHVFDLGILPWDYVPGLAVLELTESAVLLFLLGCAVLVWRTKKGRGNAIEDGLLLVWLVLPVVAIHVMGGTIYDNLRHVLFLLPSSLRHRRHWFGGGLVPSAITVGASCGGCDGSASRGHRLRPSPPIRSSSYFNSFAGGLSGAAHKYYLDPMCLTHRESASILNRIAPPHAVISAEGPYNNVISFTRKDLMIVSSFNRRQAAYLVACKRLLFTDFTDEGFVVRQEITREGAVLARLLERAGAE